MGWKDRLLNTKPGTVGRALSKGPHGHGSMPQLSTYNRGGRILSQQDLGRGGMNKGGRVGAKKGGDSRWIQKVDASIKRRGTKGKCTPITKPGCTGRAKALAKTFKKMAAKRKKS